MKNINRKNIAIVILIVLVIILMTILVRINIDRNRLQNQADRAFLSSIDLASNGLNIDYTKANEQDRIYFYSRTISNLEAAKELFPFTSYKYNNYLSYIIERLNEFLISNYSSGFTFESDIQMKIYNYLLEIELNPTDEKVINKLDEFIDSIE